MIVRYVVSLLLEEDALATNTKWVLYIRYEAGEGKKEEVKDQSFDNEQSARAAYGKCKEELRPIRWAHLYPPDGDPKKKKPGFFFTLYP
jgi:hypothetical protein